MRKSILRCPPAPTTRAGKSTRGLFVAPTNLIFVAPEPTLLARQASPVIAPNPLHLTLQPLAQPTPSRGSGLEDPRNNDSTCHLPHIPPAPGPVGGRLADFAQKWTSLRNGLQSQQTLGYQTRVYKSSTSTSQVSQSTHSGPKGLCSAEHFRESDRSPA